MRINHNIGALTTYKLLKSNNKDVDNSLGKLSSGMRINKAGDDAAGLSVSEKKRHRIRGLEQASYNANDGISMIQTAEGALNETHSLLQRIRELAVKAANDTYNDEEKLEIQREIDQLKGEVTRISTDTQFNSRDIINGSMSVTPVLGSPESLVGLISSVTVNTSLDLKNGEYKFTVRASEHMLETVQAGTFDESDYDNYLIDVLDKEGNAVTSNKFTLKFGDKMREYFVDESGTEPVLKSDASIEFDLTIDGSQGLVFHVGADNGQNVKITVSDMSAKALGIDVIDVRSQQGAEDAISYAEAAIERVSAQRSAFGTIQNRLEDIVTNLDVAAENLTASESEIRDIDMALEFVRYTSASVLANAAESMLAQANMEPENMLTLLQGLGK
ncbi:MAG: flagellin [Clostridia bacterium]|nr:flagellin [Clostridia bacterium]